MMNSIEAASFESWKDVTNLRYWFETAMTDRDSEPARAENFITRTEVTQTGLRLRLRGISLDAVCQPLLDSAGQLRKMQYGFSRTNDDERRAVAFLVLSTVGQSGFWKISTDGDLASTDVGMSDFSQPRLLPAICRELVLCLFTAAGHRRPLHPRMPRPSQEAP